MTKIKRYIIIVPLMLVLSGFFQPAKLLAGNLELMISSAKAFYLLAEPVFIDFKLKNMHSTEKAQISPELAVEMDMVSLFIAQGDDPFHKYHPGYVIEPGLPKKALEPSAAIVHRQIVLYNALTKDYAFPKPGVYKIRAVYHRYGFAPDVESNTIQIEVKMPTGTDAEALRLFKSKEVADLIMNVNEDSKAVENLELLISRHGSTLYGKYAQFYLARRQTQEFFYRKPNFEHAVKLYEKLVPLDPDFPLAVEANYRLGIALIKIGNYNEAKQRLNIVTKKAEDTRMLLGAERFLKRVKEYELDKTKKRK